MTNYKKNVHFIFVLFVALVASIGDFLIYIFNLEYLFAIIIAFLFVSIIFFRYFYKKKDISFDFEKNDVFIFLLSIMYMLSRSIFKSDCSYDVNTYHIYLQENPFLDKINFDFFPGRIFCCFLFPLGDRMHFIFRFFLGYRLGTIFSYYLAIVMFYQIKRILKILNKDMKSSAVYSYIFICCFMYISGVRYILCR